MAYFTASRALRALQRWVRHMLAGGPALSRGQATGETTLLAGSVTLAVVSLYVIVNPGGSANPIRDKICQQIATNGHSQSSDQKVWQNAAGILMGNVCPASTTRSPNLEKRRSD